MVTEIINAASVEWTPLDTTIYKIKSELERGSRVFSLYDNNQGNVDTRIASSSHKKIKEVGCCFQCWLLKTEKQHMEVRLFITRYDELSKHFEGHYVAADLKHREIRVYPDTIREGEFDERINRKEPYLERNFFAKHFPGFSYLPDWISWQNISPNMPWKMRFDKSEVGLIRKYEKFGDRFEKKVLAAFYAIRSIEGSPRRIITENQIVRISEILKRTRQGVNSRIVSDSISYKFDFVTMESIFIENGATQNVNNCEIIARINNCVTRVELGLGENNVYWAAIMPRELAVPQFMGESTPLVDSSLEDIHRYVSENCLVILDPARSDRGIPIFGGKSIQISKVTRRFTAEGGIFCIRPAIKVFAAPSRFISFYRSIKSLKPSELDIEVFSTQIDESVIKNIFVSDQVNQAAYDELTKIEKRSANVEIYISFDKTFIEVEIDQTLYVGYRFRKVLSSFSSFVRGLVQQ